MSVMEEQAKKITNALTILANIGTAKQAAAANKFTLVALKRIGIQVLAVAQKEFLEGRNGLWPRIGLVAAVFRRGKKVTSWQELDAKRKDAQPIYDSGQAFRSLTLHSPQIPSGDRGRASGVFILKPTSVEVGSADKVFIQHQEAHKWAWDWKADCSYVPGKTYLEVFNKNVPAKVNKKWNPFHFQLFHTIKKYQEINVPARKVEILNTGIKPGSQLEGACIRELDVALTGIMGEI